MPFTDGSWFILRLPLYIQNRLTQLIVCGPGSPDSPVVKFHPCCRSAQWAAHHDLPEFQWPRNFTITGEELVVNNQKKNHDHYLEVKNRKSSEGRFYGGFNYIQLITKRRLNLIQQIFGLFFCGLIQGWDWFIVRLTISSDTCHEARQIWLRISLLRFPGISKTMKHAWKQILEAPIC